MAAFGILTPRGAAFLILGLVTTLAGMVLGYPDTTRIGILLAVLPFLAMLTARRRSPQLAVNREVNPSRLAPDQPGTVVTSIQNVGPRRTPLYLGAERVDVHLGDRPRFVLPPLARGERRLVKFQLRSQTRGAYPLGPVSLRQRDPFGLTYVAVRLSSSTEVLVLPRVHDLAGPRRRATGRGNEGELPQMVALHGEDDVSIRSYRQGDELRRVHWPATAHRGELMVRQEDRPARRRAVLILDARQVAHGPSRGTSMSFEYCVSALASVASVLLAQGYVIHLLTPQTLREGTAAAPMTQATALDVLARSVRVPDSGFEAIAGVAHSFTAGGVLAVAAVVGRDADQLRQLAAIREHGSAAMAFLLDHEAFTGGIPGRPAGAARGASLGSADPSAILGEAGWSCARCGPETPIPDAWDTIQRGRFSAGQR
ncbi:MAG: DUF58 domain-containing protein [Ornithinimicrobium sp.]